MRKFAQRNAAKNENNKEEKLEEVELVGSKLAPHFPTKELAHIIANRTDGCVFRAAGKHLLVKVATTRNQTTLVSGLEE